MNYRHAFHAGNFADVMKHALLCQILTSLQRKDSAFAVLDTHAGLGLYDLNDHPAERTMEYHSGISKILAEPPIAGLEPYLEAVKAQNPEGDLRYYPGSPVLARAFLRPQDRLTAIELHPEDAEQLRRHFAYDPQVAVHHADAYSAFKAFLPPKERRGLVLIDPPFERRDEFAALLQALAEAYRRWPTGIYMIWYPIKDLVPVGRFQEELAQLIGRKVLACDLYIRAPREAAKLNGSGVIIINPPWQLDEIAQSLLTELAASLGEDDGARASVEWLAGE